MSTSYRPGHAMHPIHARLLGEQPWGWRDGIVRASGEGTHVIDYLAESGEITVRSTLLAQIAAGSPVRVHERLHALAHGSTWYSVQRDSGGLGPVPEPEHPELWAAEAVPGIVDLARGVGRDPRAPRP